MNSFPFFTYLYAEFRQSRIPHYLNHRVWEALLLAGVLLCFFISLYRIAWLSDDIYLTLRSVWNFVHGYGMRWNVHERVQAFTHPLWFFILSALYYLTRDVYYTTIILSLFLSMTTVTFFAYAHRNHPVRTAVLLLLLMYSWAFTEYCTSGLENPLSYLVLTLFVLLYGRLQQNHASFFALCLLAALSMLNRLDTALLYAPALAYVWCGLRDRRALLLGAAALTPLMAWFVFSIVYYGFPFPNTAYAKLGGGIPRAEMIVQGLRYLQNSAVRDPLTLSLIAAAVIASLWSWKSRLLPLTTSIVLYVLYTIHIGGDFMSGRFLSLPVLLSILVLARLPLMRSLTAVTVLFCFLQVCLENTALSSRDAAVKESEASWCAEAFSS